MRQERNRTPVKTKWSDAVGRVYERRHDKLLGYLGTLGVPDSEQDDVLHDAVLYALERPGDIDKAERRLVGACLFFARKRYECQKSKPVMVSLTAPSLGCNDGTEDDLLVEDTCTVFNVESTCGLTVADRAEQLLCLLEYCPIRYSGAVVTEIMAGRLLSMLAVNLGVSQPYLSHVLKRTRQWVVDNIDNDKFAMCKELN